MDHRPESPTFGTDGPPNGWASLAARRSQRRSRLLVALLVVPIVIGLVVAPVTAPSVQGDELSNAKAQQAQLKKQIADQKAKVAAIRDLQSGLAAEIASTKSDLRQIGADLNAVKKKITKMETKIAEVKAIYEGLVVQLRYMDQELGRVSAAEAAKRAELTERRAMLADRVRNAYDTNRTSPLETFLSGGTFTDLLAEMSYYIDVGEQDEALARQITEDKETLATMHQTVESMRGRTNVLRQETAAQKRALDKALVDLKETKAQLKKLEKRVAKALREQQARYRALARNKANAAAIIRKAAADQRQLSKKIEALIEKQVKRGNIPSRYNGSMSWPMKSFTVSGNYGCSSYRVLRAGQRLCPLPQRHRHGRPLECGRACGRARRRRGLRLELGGRQRPCLDRRRRALRQPAELVRAHAARLSGQCRRARQQGRADRSSGGDRPRHRGASPLDGGDERAVREPAPVPLASTRGAAARCNPDVTSC